MKVVAIHQPQYLPYLGFFHKVAHCDLFVALDHVQFQKESFQNRNLIKTSSGTKWLSVPLRKHPYDTAINAIEADESALWQKKHWNAIAGNYARARCYREFAPQIQKLLSADSANLSQINMKIILGLMELLEIRTPVIYSSQLGVEGQATLMNVNICRAVEADAYYSGPGGARYMEMSLFEQAAIEVIWQDFTHPVYEQLFPEAGFVPNLSIVDALLNCGRDVTAMVKS